MVLSNRRHNSYSQVSTKTWRRSLSTKEVERSYNAKASKAWAHDYQRYFIQEQMNNKKPIHKVVHKELNSAESDELIKSIDYYLFGEC